MTRYERVIERMRRGETVILDGGTGTEIDRRGVAQLSHAWNAGGTLSHPGIVEAIHADFIDAGAEIVITNTFAASRHALIDAGHGNEFALYNRRAVELAIRARTRTGHDDVLVAGGISYWSWTGNHPPLADLSEDVNEQADVMAAAGADLLMLEMMIDIDRMLATLDGAGKSGLPIWVGLTCNPDRSGRMVLRNGEPLSGALQELTARNVPLVSIMHTEVEHIDASLETIGANWSGLVGVYAHSSNSDNGKRWRFAETITPRDYAEYCQRWQSKGVALIGGCCGIQPEHIEAIAQQAR